MRGRKKNPDTRSAILSCASAEFAQRPFHEVLTEDIAAKLGVGKGTLYRYFESKESLYFATIVDGLQGMHAAVMTAIEEPAPLAVVIERLVQTLLTYFWTRQDFFVLLHRHEAKLDAVDREEWQERRQLLVERVRHRLGQGLPPGSVGRQAPRLAVEILFGMVRSACLYREPADRPEDLAKRIAAVFLHGIASGGRVAGAAKRSTATGRHLRPVRGGKPSS